MKRLLLTLFILLSAGVSVSLAQTVVKGRILDESGQGIPGATIVVQGSPAIGTVTDLDGNFQLAAPPDVTLEVRSLGYAPAEIAPGASTTIRLQHTSRELTGAIVTALGIRRAERSLGYAAQQLQSEDFEDNRSDNVVSSLAGKVAGVRVNSQSGTLGGSAKIVIRGSSSLSGSSQPLFVVDGLPISNSSPGATTSGVTIDYGNRAADINPDDIETMTVLKGPAATALYGSLARDGAIIITTKRGKRNAGLSVSVNSSYRVDQALVLPDLQSEYAQGNYGQYNLKFANGWGPKISDVQDRTFTDYMGRDVVLKSHPGNLDNFFENGRTFINDVALSGGSDRTDYRVSIGALNATGIVPGQTMERYNLSTNAGYSFTTKLSSRVALNYARTRSEGRPFQSSNNTNILTSSIYSIPTTVDVAELKDNYIRPDKSQIFLTSDKAGNNPYWLINRNTNSSLVDRFFGTFYTEYKLNDWLTLSNNLGTDLSTEHRRSIISKGTAGYLDGQFYDAELYNRRINNDLIATAEGKLSDDISLKVLVGNNVLDRYNSINDNLAQDLTIDELYTYANAKKNQPTNASYHSRLVSVYGEVSASYKSMLYLSVTGRNDWTSTLPLTNRSYFYPSVNGSFVFSELFDNRSVFSFGKLRASWASVGSDEDPYQLQFLYTPASAYFVQFSINGAFPHGGQLGFTSPRTIPPFNLKPQIATTREVGAELRFFRSRITLDATYYNTITRNQILSIDIPLSTGFFAQRLNAGSITNKGWELVLGLTPIQSRRSNGFRWDIDANFAANEQVVNALNGSLTQYSVQSGWSGLQIKARVGESFGLYGSKWKRSPDGQIVINPNTGLREVVTDQYLGSINPDFMLGIRNSFSFKGFTLSGLVDIRQGGVFFSGTVANLRASGMAPETTEGRDGIFIDKGVNELPDGTYVTNTTPVQSIQDFWGNYSLTDNTEGNVFDASFVKLRELSLSYQIPAKWLEHKRIKSLSFGFEARNLWLIKSYVPYVDPETSYFGTASAGDGVEFNSFPTTKSYGINLKLTL
jgi:TonB-linked SusC/RagA family outer membrane protein